MPAKKKIIEMDDKDWENWGRQFEERMERKSERFEEKMRHRFDRKKAKRFYLWSPFGLLGPVIGSIIGIIVLVIGIFLLNFFNIFVGSTFISAFSSFLSGNIQWFFLISLFFGYGKYVSRLVYPIGWLLSPLLGSAGFTFALWIIAEILKATNVSAQISFIGSASNFIINNLLPIFLVLLVLSYGFAFAWLFIGEMEMY
ncbi:MAG: hypothetical protein WC308_02885 [archaeon]|jgi:hypothetical protein